MKIKFLLTSLMVVIASCSTNTKVASDGSFKIKPYDEVTLNNGLRVLIIKDQSLPYFSMSMLVKAGSAWDGKNQRGLANFVADMLNKGSSKRDTLQIASSMEQLGSEYDTDVYKDYTLIMGSALAMHREALLNDMSEIILDPAFPKAEIERVRQQKLAGFKQLADDPSRFIEWSYESYLYGEHPYGQSSYGHPRDVAKLTQQDLQKFYKAHYHPRQAILALVGQIPGDIESRLEKTFGTWKDEPTKEFSVPAFPNITGRNILLVNKVGLSQSQIHIGHKGIKRQNPDFMAVRVAAFILGGSLSSRLMQEIREKRGLTYGINSSFDARLAEGPFLVSTFSRHEKVGEAIKESLRIVQEFKDKGVTDQEVMDAKAFMKGQFPRSLETPEKLAQNLLHLRFHGIGDEYLTNFLKNLDQLTTADINRVAKQYFNPEAVKIMVFSSKDAVKAQLEPIAHVQDVEFGKLLQ